jgi:hypothetical protein
MLAQVAKVEGLSFPGEVERPAHPSLQLFRWQAEAFPGRVRLRKHA